MDICIPSINISIVFILRGEDMANSTKKGNYESLKFLAILAAIFIIILIIYFISRGSGAKKPPIDLQDTPVPSAQTTNTPAPTIVPSDTPMPTAETTAAPTDLPATSTPIPTEEAVPTVAGPTVAPTNTPTNTPTPTVAVAYTASEAKKALETIVEPSLYTATLLSGNFNPNGDGEIYYRFSITEKATGKAMQPEMLVHKMTGSLYCYQDGKVFDCVQFPLDETEIGGTDQPADKKITAAEAVKILMTYGREQLRLPSDPSNYTPQVDNEPNITLADADGIQAYLIILLDKDSRLMGAYAVSENGVFVYIRDEMDPNVFDRIVEG